MAIKILYVINGTLNHGGTEAVVLNYYYLLDRHKVQIDFMLHTTTEESFSNPLCKNVRETGANIWCVPPRRDNIKKNYQEIIRILSSQHYDIIHVHMDCVGAYILRIAKRCGMKTRIAHSHGRNVLLKVDSLKSLLHKMYLEFCRFDIRIQATQYMACSIHSAEWLFGRKRVKAHQVYILHNAINIRQYSYNVDVRKRVRKQLDMENALVIGHVGRFSYEKNHKYLVEVFSEIYRMQNDARLLLVGTGELEAEVRNQVKALHLENAVLFYGTSSKVYELLQAMDLFVFPSYSEGFGMAAVEAQAAGLPCFVSESGQISDELFVTDLIRRLPGNRPEQWAREILRYKNYDRKNMAEELQKAGYDIDIESRKLEAYYLSL